ncbi:MAG TPA: hypothetical protein VMX35_08385 [Acidobacteriota bacterium]|nr:hypothetical protein [Acidobacteriota bacterium]
MRCANPKCSKQRPSGFISRLVSCDEGIVRENLWYCDESCFRRVVLSDYFKRKSSGSELRTSTYPMSSRDFGAALLRSGKLSWSHIEEALEARRGNGRMPLAHYLLQKGLIDRHDILEALSRHHKVPLAKMGTRELDDRMIGLIPAQIARQSGAIPIALDRTTGKISLLMRDPSDLTTMLAVKRLTGYETQAYQGDPAEILGLLERYYPKEAAPRPKTDKGNQRLAVAQ